jgi:hypothetical protein
VAAITAELSDDRRALLTDLLILDITERKRERETREAAVQSLREARAALASLDSACRARGYGGSWVTTV